MRDEYKSEAITLLIWLSGADSLRSHPNYEMAVRVMTEQQGTDATVKGLMELQGMSYNDAAAEVGRILLDGRKIAVFSTSDVQSHRGVGETVLDEPGRILRKTGALEKALEEGYEVYMVTTRTKLGDHDKWWQDLVPEHRTFIAPESDEDCDCKGSANDPAVNQPWKELYEALNLVWPRSWYKDLEMPVYWTDARHKLENLGIKLGHSFKPKWEPRKPPSGGGSSSGPSRSPGETVCGIWDDRPRTTKAYHEDMAWGGSLMPY